MTLQTPANGRETASFKVADQKIDDLLKRLDDKRVCPCCTARALAYHAAAVAMDTMGSADAIQMFEHLITRMYEHNVPSPPSMPSSEAH
jgi:hypothetical protein